MSLALSNMCSRECGYDGSAASIPVVAGAVAAARGQVEAAAAVPAGSVSTAELGESIAGLTALESQAAALRLALSAEADSRRVAEETAATGTDAWLAALTGDTREVMRGGLILAEALQQRYHATRDAFAAGRLRLAQVRVIVHAADQAPAEATPAQVTAAQEWLVAQATGEGTRTGRPANARRLRQTARRMFASIDRELADRHQAILLGRETRTADAETYLALHDNGNGTFSGKFTIPELHGHLLRDALDRLTSPRRLNRDRAGTLVVDETVDAPECLSRYEHLGVGFCELLEHLPTTGHGPNGSTLLVTISLDALISGIGVAGLDTGTQITAGQARRLACEAGLVPAVLGGASQPLDLGRERRLHNQAQRRALALNHHTCSVTGCERPFAWCEIHHHKLPWANGGTTDLDNALPLCGYHHQRAHDQRWDLRHHTNGEYRFHRRG